ncbi:MAG: hypothetical protein OET44_20890 [Gammaproteobacteria bacterium]|nr:hypothetical protein [Gammaproteobacteria bacterium]
MSDTQPLDKARQARGRRMLIGVFAVFFVPLFGAWIWFANVDDWRPTGSNNNGELIVPARPLTEPRMVTLQGEQLGGESMERSWTMVLVAGGVCNARCERNLYHTRQVRIALGKDMQRVKRLLLVARNDVFAGRPAIASEHPDLTIAVADGLVAEIAAATAAMPQQNDAIYLVDPLLNLMMRFSPNLDPRLIIKDLKRLLKVSRIG